jgi:hypothetical protein
MAGLCEWAMNHGGWNALLGLVTLGVIGYVEILACL